MDKFYVSKETTNIINGRETEIQEMARNYLPEESYLSISTSYSSSIDISTSINTWSSYNLIVNVNLPNYLTAVNDKTAMRMIELALKVTNDAENGVQRSKMFDIDENYEMMEKLEDELNSREFIEKTRKKYLSSHRLYRKPEKTTVVDIEDTRKRLEELGYVSRDNRNYPIMVYEGSKNTSSRDVLDQTRIALKLGAITVKNNGMCWAGSVSSQVQDVLVLSLLRMLNMRTPVMTNMGNWYKPDPNGFWLCNDYHNIVQANKWISERLKIDDGMKGVCRAVPEFATPYVY